MGHESMPGANSAANKADIAFAQQLIPHHEQAIEMAETELKDGKHADAKALAQDIINAQQAEIETMNDLLGNS